MLLLMFPGFVTYSEKLPKPKDDSVCLKTNLSSVPPLAIVQPPAPQQCAHLCSAINPVFNHMLYTSHVMFRHRSRGIQRNWVISYPG